METTESKSKGVIKYSKTTNGVQFYEARIETIWYDNSPRNASLPVIVTYYGEHSKPTTAYGLTHEQAINHIKSFGFDGEIQTV